MVGRVCHAWLGFHTKMPGGSMRAAVFYGPRDLRLESVAEPEPGPGDVKLRVIYNGICGSDLHEYYDGPITTRTTPHPLTGVKNPVILGHELCGEVVSCGRGSRGPGSRRSGRGRAARDLRPLPLVRRRAVQPLPRFGAARLQPSGRPCGIHRRAPLHGASSAARDDTRARRAHRATGHRLAHRESMPARGRTNGGNSWRGTRSASACA